MTVRSNPVRYSVPMLLLLTACLFYTQHYPTAVVHLGFSRNDLIGEAQGNSARQIAFLILGLVGALGVYYTRPTLTRSERPHRWDLQMLVPIAGLLGWCLLSILWSDMRVTASTRLLVVALTFLSCFGLALSWTRLEMLRFVALSSGMYLSVGVISELAGGFFHPAAGDYRFAGTLTPNEQGYLCMALVISSVCMMRSLSRFGQPILGYLSLASYGFVFLLLTRCRGALLALAVASVLYFLIVLDLKKKVLAFLLVSTSALLAVVGGLLPILTDTLTRGGEGSENLTGRGPLWTELMEYVNQKPWLGRGYESFWTVTTIDDLFRHQHWAINSAHSEYIESMLTIGVIGMVLHTLLLLMGMVEGIRLFLKTDDVVYFLAAGLCCIYLTGGFLEVLLIIKPSIVSFYLTLLLCSIALSGSVKEPVAQSQPFRRLAFNGGR
jgi:exopolysaccharide production protein ExoQ